MAGCDSYVPSPSEDLEIRTWYDLDAVRDNLAGTHTLMNDLNSTTAGYTELASPTANGGKGWEPIGSLHTEFTGSLDGREHEIRGLFINRPDDWGIGLFGFVKEGHVDNIGVVDTTVTGSAAVGGLVGISGGTVSNSYSTGDVTGGSDVGGLVGMNKEDCTVSNSYFTGSVTGCYEHIGGLVGFNSGNVVNSYATGNMTGDAAVGGLVGVNRAEGIVSDSYATGSVIGDERVGGLVGVNEPESVVSDSYATASVTGNYFVGGLVGNHHYSTVSNSYYNYDEVPINGENIITIGAMFDEDFSQWLVNDKFLDVNERLSKENGCYLINDMSDFKELLAFGSDGSLKFRLTDDLDLGDDADFYIPSLAAEFDGNDHIISNLSFNFDFVSPVGLFGYLAPDGKVTQLDVKNVNISGGENVGGLVGHVLGGTVGNCSSTGSVAGYEYVGGLVGHSSGTVSNSSFTGSVTGDSSVGGLVGIIRYDGIVSNSYSTGIITGNKYVGGLLGRNDYGTASNSYSTSSITGNEHVGGLVGFNGYDGIISNSYATGSVIGSSTVGGLVGYNGHGDTIDHCYSTGSVTGDEDVGGLVGDNWEGHVIYSFWDTETSGQATSDGGTGKTTAQMKNIATFSGAGWDIITVADSGIRNPSYIWNIVGDLTYPFLSWQP